VIKLGLIGASIARSRMPLFQRLAGERTGHPLDYALLDIDGGDPLEFGATYNACAEGGFHGVNVTFPFKELAATRVAIEDPRVRALGAVNTVTFGKGGPRGCNTDHTGFLRAYRGRFGDRPAGRVALVGAGGVGRAIAFALTALGASQIRLFDLDGTKAQALAAALRAAGADVTLCASAEDAAAGADGIVNGTPVGMYFQPGCPIAADALRGLRWAFDAVYTPEDTELLQAARGAGLEVLSGFALFLGQAADAFEAFTGARLSDADVAAIEREIRAAG
jgi:shikimate dehydrogenase